MKDFVKKIILNAIFIPFFYVGSYLVPKDKKLLLIGSAFGKKFMGNPKHLYLYIHERRDLPFKYYWITRNRHIFQRLQKTHYPVVFLYSLKGLWAILRTRVMVIEQSSQDITGRTFILGNYIIINTWHATPIKKLIFAKGKKNLYNMLMKYFLLKEYKLYEICICQSETCQRVMKQYFPNRCSLIMGYPRNDIFYNREIAYEDYYERLHLSDYERIIVYAPTFRDDKVSISLFSQQFWKELNNFLKEQNYIFLIKSHPLFANKLGIKNWSNIMDVSNRVDDIYELLIYADVLISDYSSVVFEFSVREKPIIFYPFDYQEYLQMRGFYFDYFNDMPGPFARNERELLGLLRTTDIWFGKKEYQEKYRAFKSRFNFYQDGKSSERIYNLITDRHFSSKC